MGGREGKEKERHSRRRVRIENESCVTRTFLVCTYSERLQVPESFDDDDGRDHRFMRLHSYGIIMHS